jgi:hypothetical protein
LGYAGKKEKCSLPFVHMAAMIECGTHAVVAAEIGKAGEGEDTLSRSILSGGAVEQGMVVMADAGLYSYQSLRMIIDAGADAIFRVGANVGLPVLEWLPDGSYISYIAGSGEKGGFPVQGGRQNHSSPYVRMPCMAWSGPRPGWD